MGDYGRRHCRVCFPGSGATAVLPFHRVKVFSVREPCSATQEDLLGTTSIGFMGACGERASSRRNSSPPRRVGENTLATRAGKTGRSLPSQRTPTGMLELGSTVAITGGAHRGDAGSIVAVDRVRMRYKVRFSDLLYATVSFDDAVPTLLECKSVN